jgi:F0F1-type ATP synthase membrane subunit b/b'
MIRTAILITVTCLLPAVALASGDAGEIPWAAMGRQAFNLALLLSLLVYVSRGPIRDALKNRAKTIELHLEDSNKMRREAQDHFDQLESKLSHMEGQVEQMREEATASAEREAVVIRTEAEAETARILEATEKAIRDELQHARLALQHEAAELAVGLAEKKLSTKVTEADRDRLDAEFLGSVTKEANGHG